MKKNQPKILVVIAAMLVAAIFRLIPHYPNFTPIAAIALMGGALLSNRILGFLVPLAAMLISDILTVTLINYRWISLQDYFTSLQTVFVYLSVFAMSLVGVWFGNRQHNAAAQRQGNITESGYAFDLLGASLMSAIIFFLISNFGTWIGGMGFEMTFKGLLGTYAAGIPFFGYNLLGNLFYSFLFFGFFHFAAQFWPATVRQTVR